MPGNRVAVRGEGQLIGRRSGRIIRQLCLHGVEHHRTLGQADRGAGTAVADRGFEVALPFVDRLADAGTVDAQAGEIGLQPADAREHAFQDVALNLSGRVVDDLPVQAGEPFRAGAADVLVVGNPENVGASQGVAPARRAALRCGVGRGVR